MYELFKYKNVNVFSLFKKKFNLLFTNKTKQNETPFYKNLKMI